MESTWPLSGLSAFLAAVDDAVGSRHLSVLDATEVPDTPFEIARILDGLIRRGPPRRMVVFIHDADDMDEGSQQVLGFLARRLAVDHMRIVLSVRFMDSESPFGGIPRIVLEPLDLKPLIEMGISLSTPKTSTSVLEYLARASSGNPLAFTSMLGALPKNVLEGEEPLPIPLRPGLRLSDLAAEDVAALDEGARSAFELLSCGPFLPASVFGALCATPAASLEILFAHDLVRRAGEKLIVKETAIASAIYWLIPTDERMALHEKLRAACEKEHQGLFAWHASFVPSPGEHLESLFAEASELIVNGMTLSGIQFIERARAGTEDTNLTEMFEPFIRSCIYAAEYGMARRYLHVVRKVSAWTSTPPNFAVFYLVLDYVQYQSVPTRAIRTTVGAFSTTAGDQCARLLGLAALCHLERWELNEAQKLMKEASTLAEEQTLLTKAMGEITKLYSMACEGEALPEQTDIQPNFEFVQQAFGREISWIILARILSIGERYTDARELLQVVIDQSANIPILWKNVALRIQLFNEHRASRYHIARQIFRVMDSGSGDYRSFVIDQSLAAATFALVDGNTAGATEATSRMLRLVEPGTSVQHEAQIAHMQAAIAVVRRDLVAANGHFARVRQIAMTLSNPQLLRYHEQYVETLLQTDQHVKAEEVYSELRQAALEHPSRWTALAVTKCQAMLSHGEESIEAFESMLEAWTTTEYEYLRARTLISFANRLNELGYQQRSAEVRQSGIGVFHTIGLGPQNGATDSEANAAAQQLLSALDDKELEIFRLLEKGYKNRTIAQELFVSVRTIELRLTNIYRKIGVKSRFELLRTLSNRSS